MSGPRGVVAVSAARALVGARFRPHGRDPKGGLDCVGVAGRVYGVPVPSGYALRGGDVGRVIAAIEFTGFRRVNGRASGDLLLMAMGAAQLHLAIWTGTGMVHAHAGLRRVVETPGEPPAPPIAVFRPI